MTSHVLKYFWLDVVIMLDIAKKDEHTFNRFCVPTLVYAVKIDIAVNLNFL